MLSIFACVFWPSVCLFWRKNFCVFCPFFLLGCLFFWYWAVWAVCVFWSLISCQASEMAQWKRICLLMQETQIRSLGWERSPEEGNVNPLQYSCLGNPMFRGDWQAIVHGVATELDMTQQLNHHHKNNKSLVSQIICKYFIRYVGCLFILLMISFAMQKLKFLVPIFSFLFSFPLL